MQQLRRKTQRTKTTPSATCTCGPATIKGKAFDLFARLKAFLLE
jgi:hypothetical protein